LPLGGSKTWVAPPNHMPTKGYGPITNYQKIAFIVPQGDRALKMQDFDLSTVKYLTSHRKTHASLQTMLIGASRGSTDQHEHWRTAQVIRYVGICSVLQQLLYAFTIECNTDSVMDYGNAINNNNKLQEKRARTSLKEKRTFSTDGTAKITLIKALDQKTNGNGAYVSLINGGPGQTFVTLEFKSQKGHGINFVVELYAKY
ncbi:hypothetical protein TSAR_008851, partial [Trichomalopsis sarcophagae]